jgi:quinoprotein glucose dehydrogenase
MTTSAIAILFGYCTVAPLAGQEPVSEQQADSSSTQGPQSGDGQSQDAQAPGGQDPQPEATDAAGRFPKLEFRKWSGGINVPDPVAISVDDQGRVFVTQTRRRKIQDLDIREHREWITDDLSLTSVQQKREFFKKVLAVGGDQEIQRQHVQDWNGDGQHDWRDLTVVSEVIYRLVDRDQDGTADEITTFAEDFNTEVTGVAAGVMAHDGEVYATIAPDVWKLRDHDEDGVADSREVIAHGFGLHIAYGGHDMHGLTMGPDGKVYWSIGDKGIHVTTPDGRVFAYPHQGGVMRANPDGSDFEVFAHGLRNVQEVAFDQYGNLFGVDNDSDQPDEKERFVYIVDGMDAGWRFYYQYRGDQYNPWTDERLWELAGENHPAYIVPPISHFIDGPAGFKFNPGTALSSAYVDFFFLTGAPNGVQYAFRTERDGDSFKMVDAHQIGEGIAIVGLSFGPDGGLYGADWDGGYALDEKGSVIRIDVPESLRSPEREAVREMLSEGLDEKTTDELLDLLGHADMRIRLRAQFALVERQSIDMLSATALNRAATELARLHSIWGLGQLARAGDNLGRDTIALLMRDGNPILRGQAAKTYGELKSVVADPLLPLVADADPYVRTLACLALARHPTSAAVPTLLEQSDKLEADQHYVRHAIVSALAACAGEEQLAEQREHESEMRRMCCVLALRKQASAEVKRFLGDASEWIATEAARAIHDAPSIESAVPDLAQALTVRESQSEAFFRRAVNANYRLGDEKASGRLLEYANRPSAAPDRIAHVLETLEHWMEPDPRDRVEGSYRLLDASQRSFDRQALGQQLSSFAESSDQLIRTAALAAAEALKIDFSLDTLKALVEDSQVDEATRILALESLNSQWQVLLDSAQQSSSEQLRVRALQLGLRRRDAQAAGRLEGILRSESSYSLKQSAIQVLKENGGPAAARILNDMAAQLAEGRLQPEIRLDVFEAVEQLAPRQPDLQPIWSRLQEQVNSSESKLAKFRYSRDGGNVAAGEQLFRTHVQAQCVRCHRIGRRGSEIGPPLTTIAQTRDADYLLRSILEPSADIDAKYRSQLILLESDEVLKGVVQSQNDEETVIADSEGKLNEVPTDEIVNMSEQKVSLMPEMTDVLSPREVRDLVAYLRSLK